MNPETNATTWREASLLYPTMHVQLFACAVSLAATCLWWHSYYRNTTPRSERGNCCNDPNCLRCHSSSQRHLQSFRANAQMLRRLAKLEPGLFEGMRTEIWSAIEERELAFDLEKHSFPSGLHLRCRRLRQACWKRWQERVPDATRKARGTRTTEHVTSGSGAPSSPQPGQNPSVFLLPGLEASPWHCADQCHDKCPCRRLWKALPPSDKSPPTLVTGDIETLQTNHPLIRQEFLDFLSRHPLDSNLFKPFDPKVYTAATDHHWKY